jgi:hypothetical protein
MRLRSAGHQATWTASQKVGWRRLVGIYRPDVGPTATSYLQDRHPGAEIHAPVTSHRLRGTVRDDGARRPIRWTMDGGPDGAVVQDYEWNSGLMACSPQRLVPASGNQATRHHTRHALPAPREGAIEPEKPTFLLTVRVFPV